MSMIFRRAIIAFDDADDDLRYSLGQSARRISTRIHLVNSLEELGRLRLRQSDLLVIAADLPWLAGSPVKGEGVNWVQERHGQPNPPPTIMFVEDLGRYQDKLARLDLCEKIAPNPNGYNALLAELAQRLARTRDNQPNSPKYAVVDVTVSTTRPMITIGAGVYTTSGTSYYLSDSLGDEVDPESLAQLIKESRRFGESLSASMKSAVDWETERMKWEVKYRRLGSQLYQWLATPKFRSTLEVVRGLAKPAGANQPARVALRLRVERDAYDACWEALFRTSSTGGADSTGYLFRDHTITRQIANDNGGLELEIADGVVNVLLVNSNLSPDLLIGSRDDPALRAHLDEVGDEFAPLDSGAETAALQQLSAPSTSTAGIRFDLAGDVGADPGPFSLWREVKQKLRTAHQENTPYDAIHFAGHAIAWSELTADDLGNSVTIDHSYVLFPGRPENEAVPAADFARTLAKYGVQLAYLSCCQGTAGKIAYEIATRGVPLAIGFTWDVNDSHAVHFATSFYESLLESDLRVCAAYDAARRAMHARFEGEPIWAWPVLIAQAKEWSAIETCLRA